MAASTNPSIANSKLPLVIQSYTLSPVTASIKVNNANTGDPTQISLNWEVAARANQTPTATILVNGQQVYTGTVNLTNTVTSGYSWDSGPQTIQLSSLATFGNVVQVGLNTAVLNITNITGMSGPYSATVTFVVNQVWLAMNNPPIPEEPITLQFRLIEAIPVQNPDPTIATVTVSLNGSVFYPTATSNQQFQNNYWRYNPDSTQPQLFGWYGDTGVQTLTVPALDPASPAGSVLDNVGSAVSVQLTATLTDTNSQAAYPLEMGPYEVSITPTVAGTIPQFPISYARTDSMDVSSARWMTTQVTVHADGSIAAQTTIGDANWLTGYHGAVTVVFFDQEGNRLYDTAPQIYGISGTFFGPEQYTVPWNDQVKPPASVNLIASAVISHVWSPSGTLAEIEAWLAPLTTLAQVVGSIAPYFVPQNKNPGKGAQGASK